MCAKIYINIRKLNKAGLIMFASYCFFIDYDLNMCLGSGPMFLQFLSLLCLSKVFCSFRTVQDYENTRSVQK